MDWYLAVSTSFPIPLHGNDHQEKDLESYQREARWITNSLIPMLQYGSLHVNVMVDMKLPVVLLQVYLYSQTELE